MWELFKDLGSNVQEVVETEECKIVKVFDDTGEGVMTIYHVLPGVFLTYNDFHLRECASQFQSNENLLSIDHCREGRIGQEIKQNAYCYHEAGELKIERRSNHKGQALFPLCHYHGITIGFQMDIAEKELPKLMNGFSIKLTGLVDKYCNDDKPFVICKEPVLENIFSVLYNIPAKVRHDYFRVKILEILLYLDALEIPEKKEERPYFYKGQIEKIHAIHTLLTSDLTKNYTMNELAKKFDISLTALKKHFRYIYGKPISTYMRIYRMNYAAGLLKLNKMTTIAEIASLVGYDNPSKFACAFQKEMGRTPFQYRKSFV